MEVTFDDQFQQIISVNNNFLSLDELGFDIVESIAFSPDGNTIYIVGINTEGIREVISLDLSTGESTVLAELNDLDLQITVGADGTIYGVSDTGEIYSLDNETGEVQDEGDDLGEGISDIASGPEEEATEVSEE